ncbi:MAG: YggS family pyridoxal phosphate-dependent enzyme [Parachlamydiaceae bacterium]
MNERYAKLKEAIATAAIASGRSPHEITLVAVTKTIPWNECSWLYRCGHHDFGESRVVEALQKKECAPSDCRWHLIGTLQTNKVRKAVGQFALIHSVDTIHLAEKISECSLEMEVKTKILLQVNTSGELTKHGLSPNAWRQCYEKILPLKGISIEGLMTMAPDTDDEKNIRQCFAHLRHFRDELKAISSEGAPMHHLSMGMSNDFRLAIDEGATIIRIGSLLF